MASCDERIFVLQWWEKQFMVCLRDIDSLRGSQLYQQNFSCVESGPDGKIQARVKWGCVGVGTMLETGC